VCVEGEGGWEAGGCVRVSVIRSRADLVDYIHHIEVISQLLAAVCLRASVYVRVCVCFACLCLSLLIWVGGKEDDFSTV